MAKVNFQIISHLFLKICVHFKDILGYIVSSKLNIYSMKGDQAKSALTIQKYTDTLQMNTILIYFKLSLS